MAQRRRLPVLGLLRRPPRQDGGAGMTPMLDGPRIAPASGGLREEPGGVPAWLRRRRQRPHRHRPACWRPVLPDDRVRLARMRRGCARRCRAGGSGSRSAAHRPRQAPRGRPVGGAGTRCVPRRRTCPPRPRHDALALVGFSQGAMMALHVGPRRPGRLAGIVGYSGLLAGPEFLRRSSQPPADAARPWRGRSADPGDGHHGGGTHARRAPASRSNGTSARASPTASTRRGWGSAPIS